MRHGASFLAPKKGVLESEKYVTFELNLQSSRPQPTQCVFSQHKHQCAKSNVQCLYIYVNTNQVLIFL